MSELESRTPDRAGRGLGWTSLALGLPALLAPEAFSRAIGLSGRGDDRTAARAVGAQELLVGAGLLTGRATRPLLWSRVAGDVVHLSMLRKAMAGGGGDGRTRAATAAVAGIGAVDLLAALRHARTGSASPAPMELTATATVNKRPQEVYDFWRGLERLPRFMHHLESVEWLDERTTRWKAAAPVGKVGWDAELVDDVRGERISWRSLPGATVPNEGSVDLRPAPGGKGTEVRVHLSYAVPGGRAGRAVARMLGEEPHQQVEDDLRRFKQVMETGEVVRSDGSPDGHSASRQLIQRPAQPVG
jgi:uncharacterized membrane protein